MTGAKLFRLAAIGAAMALTWALGVESASAVTFSTFVSAADISAAESQNQTIGFSYAGNKFVGSVYFGTNNNQLYSTDLAGGNVAKFGPPIPGASGEIFVASSLGLGGFPNRDIYAAVGAGVFQITNDGSSGALFVSGLAGAVRGMLFDAVGTFGNQMLVTTNSGNVYRVNSAGTATLLASVGEDTEGLDVAPLGAGFGAFDGQLIVASEGSGLLRAISTTGVVTPLVSVASAEELTFVPLDLGLSGNPVEGWYGACFPVNVQKAGASQFAGMQGSAVVTGETTSRMSRVQWNGSAFVVSDIGGLPCQPEDGIFVTAAIITGGGGTVPGPAPLVLLGSGLALLGGLTWRRSRRN